MPDFGPVSMTKDDADAFLGAEFKTEEESLKAALATLLKDGSPHVIPVGFWYDGDYLYFTFSVTRGAVPRIRRDARVSVSVFRQYSPGKFVTVSGRAEEIADPDNAISKKILRRYPRPPGWDKEGFEAGWLQPGKVVFRLAMTKWVGMDNSKVDNIVLASQTPADRAFLRSRGGKGANA